MSSPRIFGIGLHRTGVEEFRCRDAMGGFTRYLQTGCFLVGFG